jgi:hypothetical protein
MGRSKKARSKGQEERDHAYIWHPKTLISNPGDFSICQSIDLSLSLSLSLSLYICVCVCEQAMWWRDASLHSYSLNNFYKMIYMSLLQTLHYVRFQVFLFLILYNIYCSLGNVATPKIPRGFKW